MIAMWEHVEETLRRKAYGTLDNDPQILLEQDGGPYGVKADLIYARLIGFEDEIVEDGVRLSRIEPTLLMPILRRPAMLVEETPISPSLTSNVAEYVLQSGYAWMPVAAEYAPPGVELDPTTFTFSVLYLRYRRRR